MQTELAYRIHEVLILKLGWDTDYSERFSWLFPVPPGACRDSTSIWKQFSSSIIPPFHAINFSFFCLSGAVLSP
jgi:hypothetical protein